MKKRKISVQWRSVLTLLAFVITFSGFAQTKTVSGTVVDKQNEPLIGVAVKVQGTSIAVATNIDGKFVLTNVPETAVLDVSFVGMKPQKVSVAGTSTLTIVLVDDTEVLKEVVITAFGIPKQSKSVGYATSKVSTTEIERVNAINPVAALQGKVAGMSINAGGASGVTSSSSITIRGSVSISDRRFFHGWRENAPSTIRLSSRRTAWDRHVFRDTVPP